MHSASDYIRQHANSAVMEELDSLMDVDRDPDDFPEGYTYEDALDDLYDRAEWNGWKDFPQSMKTNMRKLLVGIGRYREVTEEELSRTVCTGKAYSFKLDGKKYVSI